MPTDHTNSPYGTLSNGVGGGKLVPGRPGSVTSMRPGSAGFTFDQQPSTSGARGQALVPTQQRLGTSGPLGSRGRGTGITGSSGRSAPGTGPPPLYAASHAKGNFRKPHAACGVRCCTRRVAVHASEATAIQQRKRVMGTGGSRPPSAGAGWPLSPSGSGNGSPQAPISQRLAQTKAVFAAAKFNRNLQSMLAGGISAQRPEAQALASATARPSRPASGVSPARREGARPVAYTCFLCGQPYGSQSLMKHIPQCQKKWHMVEGAKPARERRPVPPMPPELESGQLPSTAQGIEEFNQRMYSYWDKVSLVGCPICARTFRPDAFEKHSKVCTPDNPGGPLGPNKHAAARAARPASGIPGPNRPPSSGAASSGGYGTAGGRTGGATSPSRRDGARPVAFTCFLCGQQYGSQSLLKHIPQCQKKWQMVEGAKPPRERRALPPVPPELESGQLPSTAQGIEEFNQRMYSYWDKVSLVACPICARTFRPDAFEKHNKVCTPDNPGGPLGPGKRQPPPSPTAAAGAGAGGPGLRDSAVRSSANGLARRDGERPRAYMCYLCGQQFGSQSLLIHVPQCYEKWLKVESAKAPKERREPPPPPPQLDEPLPMESAAIDEFNTIMSGIFNGCSLMPCQHCGRTMRPEALTHHQKACTAERPMARPGGAAARPGGGSGPGATGAGAGGAAYPPGGGGADDGSEQELEPCPNCNRRMRPDALAKHQRLCTPGKPMKAMPPRQPPPQQQANAGGGGDRGPSSSSRPSSARPGTAGGNGMMPQQAEGYGTGDDSEYSTGVGSSSPNVPPDAGEDGFDEGSMVQCNSCGRRFLPGSYERHARVCAKVFSKPRKVYNSAAKRAIADAAAFCNPRTTAQQNKQQQQTPARAAAPAAPRGAASAGASAAGGQSKWKAQSEQLRAAMANMRTVSRALAEGKDIRDIPVQPSAPDPSYVQCPSCGRRFNQKAAERHIPLCGDIAAKPKFLKAGTGGAGKGAPQSKMLPRY